MRWILSALKEEAGSKQGERKRHSCQPECEAIVDEGGDRPDDKEGKGDREDTWVEAVEDGVPQHFKLSKNQTLEHG